jgi:hypothetical protein
MISFSAYLFSPALCIRFSWFLLLRRASYILCLLLFLQLLLFPMHYLLFIRQFLDFFWQQLILFPFFCMSQNPSASVLAQRGAGHACGGPVGADAAADQANSKLCLPVCVGHRARDRQRLRRWRKGNLLRETEPHQGNNSEPKCILPGRWCRSQHGLGRSGPALSASGKHVTRTAPSP